MNDRSRSVPALDVRGLDVYYGHSHALQGVDLRLESGVFSLVGRNGMGKTTLCKAIMGLLRPSGGSVRLRGEDITGLNPARIARLGVGYVPQGRRLWRSLSVDEHLRLAAGLRRGAWTVDRVYETFPRLAERRNNGGGQLSGGEQQMLAISRALLTNPQLLIMDEPTTSLSAGESEKLFALIRQLRAEGLAIIYISHRMDEVYALGDRVTVLRDGRLVGSLDKPEIRADSIVRMMVGRDVSSFYKKDHDPHAKRDRPVLTAVDLGDGHRVKGCSLTVHAGEVVGLAGLIGAGRTELAHLIIGATPKTTGHVTLDGERIEIETPRDALDAGIAYLTEDRKALGLFLDMSCADNINLAVIGRDARLGGVLDRDKARLRADEAFSALGIRAPNPGVTVGGLSGGNQQKVLLSRLLATAPKVLILDEPTRGVDVGAKSEIYSIIDNLAKSGTAILVISSDLPEILGICDRVLVMRSGQLAGELQQSATTPITQEDIMALATGTEHVHA